MQLRKVHSDWISCGILLFVCLASPRTTHWHLMATRKTGSEQIFPGFGSNHLRPKLTSALCIHTNSPHQLQRQHPPPKPPASLSTVIKVPPPHLTSPTRTTPTTPCTQLLTCGGEGRGEERGEERRRDGEVALSGGRLRVRLACGGSWVTTLTLSLSVSLSPSSLPLPNVGYPSHCLTAVCQTIPLSPLWGTGWTPSRWAATVTTLSTPDLLPLTWWPRWQQSEWRAN